MLADGRNRLAPGARYLSGRSHPAGTRYLRPIVRHRGWQMMEVELLNEKGAGDALGRSLATLSFFAFLPFFSASSQSCDDTQIQIWTSSQLCHLILRLPAPSLSKPHVRICNHLLLSSS